MLAKHFTVISIQAYLVLNLWKACRTELVEVLPKILIWEITAKEHTVYQTIFTGKLLECTVSLALIDEIEETLQIEAR